MVGYGFGHMGQGISYCFMSTYLVVYLTECVGLSSSKASTISALALAVEVIVGMIIGNASDNCTSKMGRRRPFMLFAAIGMAPIFILLFHYVELSETLKFVYYLFFAILFRVFFASFEIPNQAFGAELAFGYDERTRMRTICRVFSVVGNTMAYLVPLYMLRLIDASVNTQWQIIGIFIGVSTSLVWYTAFFLNRGKGVILKEKTDNKINPINILKNYMELAKLKPTKNLILYKAGFTSAYALINISTIYYFKYSVLADEKFTAYNYWITMVIFFSMIPLANKMAIKFGKTKQQLYVMTICGIYGIVMYFLFPTSVVGAYIYFGLFSIVQTSFWQLSSAVFYDVIEVDEWVNGKRREGDMMSMVSVLGTFISALVVQLFGILFDAFGYDSLLTIQNESTVNFLNFIFILAPSIFLILCALSLKSCPINKKTFESLQLAINARKDGKDYSEYMDDVKKITGEK